MTQSDIAHAYHNRAAEHVLRAIAADKLAIELRDYVPASHAIDLIAIAEALSDYAAKHETIWPVFPGTQR